MLKTRLVPLLSVLLACCLWFCSGTVAQAQISLSSTSPILMAPGKSLFSFSGVRPTNLGVKDGKLAACPQSPNCVSSQITEADATHSIAPLSFKSSGQEAIAALKSVVEGMERTEILNSTDDYFYAEFTTPLMGFVDDVEFYVDEAAKVIHVRSASRLGESDMGLNRKRVEEIRTKFAALNV